MRKSLVILGLLTLVFAMAVNAGDEAAWFDMKSCAFCVSLTEPPDMLDNLGWEHHNISNGIISISTVPEKYKKAYAKAMDMMTVSGEKMAKGEMVHTCGMCTNLGALMQKGAKWEQVETMTGNVRLFTSDKPELVAELQAWGKRTTEEMAKAMSEEVDPHAGHNH